MSRFFSKKYEALIPYTPGEQPRDQKYIKLNTNESPFPPSPSVEKAVREEVEKLRLYSDPECKLLAEKFAERYDIKPENVILTNGSDEVLNFAFMAFSDKDNPIAFPDITYGFYSVFAELNGIPYKEIPLADDFSVKAYDYIGIGKNIVIANPNAPTGMTLSLSEIEKIVKSNPDNVVIIDEAYVDFGGESAVKLTKKYDNLLVTGTFSKSRSLAGARLGFGIGNAALISDLHTIRYSTNPYNINRLTMVAGYRAICDDDYYMNNAKTIMENRVYTREKLEKMGFSVLPSSANFLFAESDKIDGETLYLELKKRGVLIRHFTKERIKNFNRITIGTREEMDIFISNVADIMETR